MSLADNTVATYRPETVLQSGKRGAAFFSQEELDFIINYDVKHEIEGKTIILTGFRGAPKTGGYYLIKTVKH